MGNRNVFTCSMADLFGKWVPQEWISAVLGQVEANPQWNFLFLTKFPVRLAEFEFPDNAWVGTTVDCQARVKNAERSFRRVQAAVKWLSVEPLLEPLTFDDLGAFQWIVLGGASASSQTPEWHPPREWSEALRCQAQKLGIGVYEKRNLLERVRQYPGLQAKAQDLPKTLRYLPTLEAM
jgi:protein gp37